MTDFGSRAGDEMERAVSRAKLTWEWWFVFALTAYLAGTIIPWLAVGAPVVGRG